LLVDAFVTLVICQTQLRNQNLETLRGWASKKGRRNERVNRLTWSVEAVGKRMKNATCLCKALALQHLLARSGHDSELRIGVDKAEGKFSAHAWLIYRGRVLMGGAEMQNYKLIATLATGPEPERGQNDRIDGP
jgi:hypothetical protein